jgi:monoterpene epsilon-lactone hydrolase
MRPVAVIVRLLRCSGWAVLFTFVGGSAVLMPTSLDAADPPPVDEDGTVHVPAFLLPESSFLSKETLAALKSGRDPAKDPFLAATKACPPIGAADSVSVPLIRKCQADVFTKTPFYKGIRERYTVLITPKMIGGVYTETFTPSEGVPRKNRNRLLINLHGGELARINGQLESIPIASIGKIKVISIDFRQPPESTFPAATEDVATVYRELLKKYEPNRIGLYGCSSGGALTAQSIAWLLRHQLPLPGAIGLFCYGADSVLDGEKSKSDRSDSAHLIGALSGQNAEKSPDPYYQYYIGVDRRNPLASPGDYEEVLAKFPSSLLISGTRDPFLSSVLVTHAKLVRLGVHAELHVWEGMYHAFHYFPEFPESREAYSVIVKFFDAQLER